MREREFVYFLLFNIINISSSSNTFHSFTSLDIDGNKFELEDLSEKAVLVVNVASECGYTHSHYTDLQQLYQELHHTHKFEILGYPCNQFGGQEPGSPQQIKQFLKQYQVTFPVMAKVDVISENADPVWKFLVKASGVSPKWNFFKYLVDGNGDIINVWAPDTPVKDIADTVRTVVHQEELHQMQVERPDSPFIHDEF